jgi:enoyl-CoA hydratase/carnithine racemase
LTRVDWTDAPQVNRSKLSDSLRELEPHAAAAHPVSNIQAHADIIARVTEGQDLGQTVKAIGDLRQHESPWLAKAAAASLAGSPTSLALIWEIWQRSRRLTLAEAFRQELILSVQCCSHPDFAEGVRALLVDKDNSPRWTPPRLQDVSPEWVNEHFVPPWGDQPHPLSDLD